MRVSVDLCLVPIGVGVSLSPYVAACQTVLQEAGLDHQLQANGTAVEGEWAEVFAAIERCHDAVHALGAPRIYTVLKVNTRTDRDQSLEEKVASVRARLA
ncbi:MTH1187 family thiamine-binding protein [Synechococcus sp. RSCCF101]|uniref:MTH1187 family thiamine-binding protein n=1 Tax=Synechococcus sp. RSCCF101 TaxID=2511069 RepID=UPI0012469763|nr:MTH1187 family thiamine-binding protein [Synechococcus sp. RSCCF101]QEY31029.1 MTH1187 family thiamine-binding protein [Synechococcus sp. RSCCF101]